MALKQMNMIEKNSWLTCMAASFTICLCACSKIGYKHTHGELVGTPKKKGWSLKKPHGMSLIPAGAFTMGNSSYDPIHALDAPAKTASVNSFYMDETEITNREYHQFVNWVRDSIVRTLRLRIQKAVSPKRRIGGECKWREPPRKRGKTAGLVKEAHMG
ncbi:MAG: SUMF1/EgtB/PvdO family nonheme iron enzyme [Flavobacteriales bacterium]